MAKKTVYYDVYEGNKLYLQCVTREEINEMLGINRNSFQNYIDHDWKVNGKYRICPAREQRESKSSCPAAFEQRWEEAIRPFRNVIWSKTEGKKLLITRAS